MYLWKAHLLNVKRTGTKEYIMYIDFCTKTQSAEPIIFKGLHTLWVVRIQVKSHKITETSTLCRQSFAEDENIIRGSNSKYKNNFLTFLLGV